MDLFYPIHRHLPHLILDNPLSVAYPLSFLLLAVATCSLTFIQHHRVLRYFRLFLFAPTATLLTVAWFPKGVDAGHTSTLFWIGILCFFKSFDVMVVSFGDDITEIPRWMSLKWKHDNGKEEVTRTRLPLPTDLRTRLSYTVDSMLSVQGGSFFKDRVLDWAPPPIYQYRSGGRKTFLLQKLKRNLLEWFMLDLLETIVTEAGWDIQATAPLSGSNLSMVGQIFYTGLLGLFVYFTMFIQWNIIILLLVSLFHLNPDSWPPLWRNPWEAHSLADFWGHRWHWSFRRSFTRTVTPFVHLLKPFFGKKSLDIVRLLAVFTLSTLYHLGVSMVLEGRSARLPFWEPGTIKFFMSQPIAILFERLVINPITESLPGRYKSIARRVFVWSWMLYTGRWFADQFLKQGVLEEIPPVFPIHTLYRKYWTPDEYLGWGVTRPGPFSN